MPANKRALISLEWPGGRAGSTHSTGDARSNERVTTAPWRLEEAGTKQKKKPELQSETGKQTGGNKRRKKRAERERSEPHQSLSSGSRKISHHPAADVNNRKSLHFLLWYPLRPSEGVGLFLCLWPAQHIWQTLARPKRALQSWCTTPPHFWNGLCRVLFLFFFFFLLLRWLIVE